jgi:hypothetical protein
LANTLPNSVVTSVDKIGLIWGISSTDYPAGSSVSSSVSSSGSSGSR